jgi:cell division protein FtsB
MTELENRLLTVVRRLEQSYQDRERQFAQTRADLTRQLNNSAAQITSLSAHVNDLARRIELLHAILNKR